MKKSGLLLALLLAVAPMAQALDNSDQGEYQIVRVDGTLGTMQMKLFRQGRQWMMDGRQLPETQWSEVCRATGECKLVDASSGDVAEWKKTLPEDDADLQNARFNCIKNIAMGFCRIESKAQKRIYIMFALVRGTPQPIVLHRLK